MANNKDKIDQKYGSVDDLLKPRTVDTARSSRRKRPTPALDAMAGNLQASGTVNILKQEKLQAEQALQEAQQKFEKEKAELMEALSSKEKSESSDMQSSIMLTMPVTQTEVAFQWKTLDPSLIDVSPENERIQSFLDEISLRDILGSIKTRGQQKPGTVRPKPNGRYELIEGSRRLAAVKLAGKSYLALVGDVPDEDVRELSVIENKHQDVSPYEKAKAFQSLIENLHYENWTQLGEHQHISSSHINRYKQCAEMDEIFVRLLPSPSEMPLSYGETIAGLKRKNEVSLLNKAQELVDLREQAKVDSKVVLLDVDKIIKILKESVKSSSNKPTVKKPIKYVSKNKDVVLKYSITNNGNTKFEIAGVPEDKIDKVLQYLLKTLRVDPES